MSYKSVIRELKSISESIIWMMLSTLSHKYRELDLLMAWLDILLEINWLLILYIILAVVFFLMYYTFIEDIWWLPSLSGIVLLLRMSILVNLKWTVHSGWFIFWKFCHYSCKVDSNKNQNDVWYKIWYIEKGVVDWKPTDKYLLVWK